VNLFTGEVDASQRIQKIVLLSKLKNRHEVSGSSAAAPTRIFPW
jgi:hypothetical protein